MLLSYTHASLFFPFRMYSQGDEVAQFHVGDIITRMHKCSLMIGGPEVIVYGTSCVVFHFDGLISLTFMFAIPNFLVYPFAAFFVLLS